MQRAAFIVLRIVEENRAAEVAAQRRPGQLEESGVGVGAVMHARLVAGDQRRRHQHREGELAELLAAARAPGQQLGALLIGAGLVQLLVLLGLVVRVGDPAVDERRARGDAPALGDLGVGQNLQDPVHQPPRRARSARASSGDFSAAARAWQARRRCRAHGTALPASAISSPRRLGAVFIFERLRVAAASTALSAIASIAAAAVEVRRSAAIRAELARHVAQASRSKSTQSICPIRHGLSRSFERASSRTPRRPPRAPRRCAIPADRCRGCAGAAARSAASACIS